MLIDLLRSTVEWQNWGFNALTISFIATVCFGIAQTWSLRKQHNTIVATRSSGDLDPFLFAFIAGVMFAFNLFGVTEKSLAMVLNGLLGIPYLLVHKDILDPRYSFRSSRKYPTLAERIVMNAMMLGFPTIMALIPLWLKEPFLLLIMAGSLVPLLRQSLYLWRHKTAKSVEVRFVLVFAGSCAFWFVYALTTGKWSIYIVNALALVILATIYHAWHRFGRKAAVVSS